MIAEATFLSREMRPIVRFGYNMHNEMVLLYLIRVDLALEMLLEPLHLKVFEVLLELLGVMKQL